MAIINKMLLVTSFKVTNSDIVSWTTPSYGSIIHLNEDFFCQTLFECVFNWKNLLRVCQRVLEANLDSCEAHHWNQYMWCNSHVLLHLCSQLCAVFIRAIHAAVALKARLNFIHLHLHRRRLLRSQPAGTKPVFPLPSGNHSPKIQAFFLEWKNRTDT